MKETAFIFIVESLLQMRLKAKMRGMSLKVVHHVGDYIESIAVKEHNKSSSTEG